MTNGHLGRLGIAALLTSLALARAAQAEKGQPTRSESERSARAGETAARAEVGVSDEKAARSAFEEGRKLLSDGQYDEACAKFEESLSLTDAIGTRYNLADCETHRDHFARAQTLFLAVADQAHDQGQPEREKVARDRASALDPKLSLLKLEFEHTARCSFTLDDQRLEKDAVSAAIPLDPGKHRLSVSAPGKRSWSKQLDIPRGGLLLTVAVPELEAAHPPKVAPKSSEPEEEPAEPVTHPSPRPAAEPARGQDQHGSPAARRVALVLGGIGAGATIAGVAFGMHYLSSNSDAKDTCPSNFGCSAEQIAQHDQFVSDAKRARTLTYLGLGVGAAALTSAAVLYFTVGSDHGVSASTGWNADGTWRATVQGRF